MLVGSIDLLALDNDRALVVDYKTGNRPLAADEARQRYRLQGQCYALAAMAAGGSRVRVVFAELERGREIVFEYGLDDRAGIETAIAGIVSGISAHEFRPRSTYESGLCDSCPGLGGMCSVTRPGPGAAG
jgi:RecB family exonuclease